MKEITASAARADFFNVLDQVARSSSEAVVIRRRGRGEGVALVRESRLRYLEARINALEARAREEPFRLIGSITVHGDVEEIVAENRAEQNRLFEEKLDRIFADN